MTDSPLASEYIAAGGMGGTLWPNAIRIHCTAPSSLADAGVESNVRADRARSTALYFSRITGASAHYTCDIATIVQSVPEDRVAYHDGDNRGTIGIEICGQPHWTRAEWLSPPGLATLTRTAALVADIAARHGIPLFWQSDAQVAAHAPGMSTHADKSRVLGGDHWDPGPDFPRDVFLELCTNPDTGDDDMPTAGEIATANWAATFGDDTAAKRLKRAADVYDILTQPAGLERLANRLLTGPSGMADGKSLSAYVEDTARDVDDMAERLAMMEGSIKVMEGALSQILAAVTKEVGQ